MQAVSNAEMLALRCEYDEALAYLKSLSAEVGHETNVLLAKATILGHLKRFSEAASALELIDESSLTKPELAAVMLSRGLIFSGLKQTERSLAALERARLLGGDAVLITGAVGITFAEAERYEEAERAYRDALRLAPELPSALFNLSALEARKGRIDEAIKLLRQSWSAGQRNPKEIRLEPLLKPVIESGRIDDLLKSPDRACLL
jgi:tetratricopeptide (TPR) repeat protein